MKKIIYFLTGLMFGIGLIISGMTNPNKIIGFLNLSGYWDPSLMFVMMGAIPVSYLGYRYVEQKHTTYWGEAIQLPGKTHINKELIMGSLIFGAGWSLAGFCPGPALVVLGVGSHKAATFVIAMLIGMNFHDQIYLRFVNPSSQ